MLLFTNQARHVIDAAVQRTADERARLIWAAWAKDNPQLRRPDGITHDYELPPAPAVVMVVVSALEGLQSLREQMNGAELSEDAISGLENDLTYIAGLAQLWQRLGSGAV